MRRKKLNDEIDLEVHDRLTDLAERIGVPRATLVRRLLAALVPHVHHGRLLLNDGEVRLWPVGDSVISVGRLGPAHISEAPKSRGVRLAEIEFRTSR